MSRIIGCLLLLFVSAPAASAQSLKLPAIVLGAAGAADIATTAQFLSDPSYNLREINPAVNWIKNPTLMLTFGAAVETTTAVFLTNKLAKRHPKWAAAGLYVAGGVHAYYAMRNLHNMKKYRT